MKAEDRRRGIVHRLYNFCNYTDAYQSIQYQPDYRHFFGFSLPPAPSEGGGAMTSPPPSEGAGGRLNSYQFLL